MGCHDQRRATHRISAGPISRVLLRGTRISTITIYIQNSSPPVIYLRRRSLVASSNLPPGIGRATLHCRYTRSCNPRDVRTERHCCPRGRLLPHLFTLTASQMIHQKPEGGSPNTAVIFCYACHKLSPIKSLACVVLYVARTFLPRPKRSAATERTCTAKISTGNVKHNFRGNSSSPSLFYIHTKSLILN